MGKLQTKTYDRRRRTPSSRFFCCFGISKKPEGIILEEDSNEKPIPTVDRSGQQKGKHRITVRLAFLGLRVPKSTCPKTVPVILEKDIKLIHYKSKSTFDRHQSSPPTTATAGVHTVVPTAPDHIILKENKALQNNKIVEDNKTNTPPQENTSQIQKRLSFVQRIEAIRCGSSQPNSPRNSPKHTKVNSQAAAAASVKRAVMPKQSIGRFEPIVGMSVVMVTLVIMIMWGRLCAILCTSAWLYFVPRFVDPAIRAVKHSSDLGSEESKKKVVFEGFLERPKKPSKTTFHFQ